MDTITLLKRDRNYDSSKKGLNWLTSSLLHSLRMTQNEYDEFEANQKLRNSNKIEIDNEVRLLDDYDVNSLFKNLKNDLLSLINDTSTNPEDEKEKNYLRGLKRKIKDFSNECSDEITDFINLSIENKQFDENAYRELLTNNGVKRIQQRISLLEKYITLSGKVSDDKVKGFVNRVKEVIVVIPSTNKIPTIDLYGDFTRTTLTNFYKDNFKDFNILFAVSHLDETTPHSHMFLDLKNKKTAKYDFAVKELEFAIKYSQNMPNVKKMPLLEDYKLKGRKESKQEYIYKKELNSWKAEIVQTAFFDYFNKKSLEADLGLNAEKLAPTKERNRRNKIIEEEAKKPKAERNFNYYTKQLEDMELKINILTKELNNSKEEKKEMTTKIIELKTKFDKGNIAVKNLKDKEKSLNQKIESQSETIKSKDNELNKLKNNYNKEKPLLEKLKAEKETLDAEIEKNKKSIEIQEETIKIKEDVFNKEVDRICDILNEENDIFIDKIDKRLGKFQDFYIKISVEVNEAKKAFKDTMDEFVSVMSKMKKLTLEFSIIKNKDKRNGILDGFLSFMHLSMNEDKKVIEEFYKNAKIEFEENETKTLLLVEQAVNNSKEFDEIKEINPIFKNVVEPIIDERKQDLKTFEIMDKELKVAFKEIRQEIIEETKINKSRFKIKM